MMSTAGDAGLRRSLYRAVTSEAPSFPPLAAAVQADVVVIGGGITGLSSALHLAETGKQVILLEAREIGWGASGRNGGQVNPGLKADPDEIRADFGERRGSRLIDMAGNAPAYLFALIKRFGIDCAAINSGTIRVVKDVSEGAVISRSVEQWRRHGVQLRQLDRTAIDELSGTDFYPCGLLDPRGGQLNPLAYSRGLAKVAAGLGVRIHAGSPALSIRERTGAGWSVSTAGGSVEAEHVVLATNGYTDDLWPGLRRSVIPVFSAIAATDPLPDALREAILPGRQVLYESSWRVLYFRVDDGGRFLMGGPSNLHPTSDEKAYAHLVEHAYQLYPALRRIPFAHFWNGQVAITKDHYPHMHEPARGVIAALGYNGRGVAMATAMGNLVARRIAGADAEDLALPVTEMRPFPFHALWKPAVAARRIKWSIADRMLGKSR